MQITFLMQDTGAVYGAERATLDLAAGLQGAGCSVRMLLIGEKRLGVDRVALREAVASAGLGFTVLPTAGRFSWELVENIRDALRDGGADILHTVGYKADLHGGLAGAWGRRTPLVATVHGWLFRPDLKERFYKWVDVRSLRRFSRVIALSSCYDQMLASHGIARERLVRIPSGLDAGKLVAVETAERTLRQSRPVTFGMLGRLSWEKHHDLFLWAAKTVLKETNEARFVIAGDGPDRAAIGRRVKELGLESAVEFAGYVPTGEFFRRVDVLAVCSRMENLPYSVMEAMSWCRPVIATNVGGLPDLVRDGETGYLVPPDDADAMAQRMLSLLKDKDRILLFGREGRKVLTQEFLLERTVRRHLELYASLEAPRG